MTDKLPDLLIREELATPIGTAILIADGAGTLRAFDWTDYEPKLSRWLARRYPRAEVKAGKVAAPLRQAFERYFAGDPAALEGLRWRAVGTEFQQTVWQALCAIPVGETITYSQLAARVGRPTAVRAVGLANGANPLALVAPCHRVIGANGSLTGYGGGLHRKLWLLRHEGVQVAA